MALEMSGRPLTSVLASTAPDSISPVVPRPDSVQEPQFIPNVFDLISVAQRAEQSVVRPALGIYWGAQAVDSSVHIGQGASFEVSSRVVPEAAGIEHEINTGGLRIVEQEPRRNSRVIVYKTARIGFSEFGEVLMADRRAIDSVLMEIYALSHPPLQKHPNIIKFLGLAWGSNPFNPLYKLPVIVVEHAEHGNLAALQEKELLDSELKLGLCTDVGQGLQALHRCGIIHGDVKSENILIFSHADGRFTAKVSDFGFSIVGAAAANSVRIGGTQPWKAPESNAPVVRDQLPKTDIYSFGLLVWRVAVNGVNPFSVMFKGVSDPTERAVKIEKWKESGDLVGKTGMNQWHIPVMLAMQNPALRATSPSASLQAQLRQLYEHFTEFLQSRSVVPSDEMIALMRDGANLAVGHSSTTTELLRTTLLTCISAFAFYSRIGPMMAKCLGRDPASRDLDVALQLLKGSNELSSSKIQSDEVLHRSYNEHILSWPFLRDVEPAVQTFIFERYQAAAHAHEASGTANTSINFILASCYINGYGTTVNVREGLRMILLAAQNQHAVAQAYIFRFNSALGSPGYPSDDIVQYLQNQAMAGSRTALQDLHSLALEKWKNITTILRSELAGVGAPFFVGRMTQGFTYTQWMNTFDNIPVLVQNLHNLRSVAEYKVNSRGDRILHIAAACGKKDALSALLQNFAELEINQLNDQGETPLLCACRAGQIDVVDFLLEHQAKASIATPNNESPLHWLVSFQDDQVERIATALVSKGADIRLMTTTIISYSGFPAVLGVDQQWPGGPLTWAVRHNRPAIVNAILSLANDARICLDKQGPHPPAIERAASYHHTACLRLMINSLKASGLTFTYSTFLSLAAHGTDVFSMVLQHGEYYRATMKTMFDYLFREMTKHRVTLSRGIGGFGYTLLYYAVSEAHDALVEYLLSSETEELLRTEHANLVDPLLPKPPRLQAGVYSAEHINQACGEDRRSPILECVRWNRQTIFDLLIDKGASISTKARNPYDRDEMNWTALHIFAQAGHNSDTALVDRIVPSEMNADARSVQDFRVETPLVIALHNNAFNLATSLLGHGADVNALASSSGLLTSDHPITVLGHIIATAARHSVPRLRYLLHDCPRKHEVDFIVEPERCLSALHRAAWAHRGLFSRVSGQVPARPLRKQDVDASNNRAIAYELLQHFSTPSQLNLRCRYRGSTALHLAVEATNLDVVNLLLSSGVDSTIQNEQDQTPMDLAVSLVRHDGIKCNGCGCDQIQGTRWRCQTCPEYNLCDECRLSPAQAFHRFEMVSLSGTVKQIRERCSGNVISQETLDMAQVIEVLSRRDGLIQQAGTPDISALRIDGTMALNAPF